MSIVSGRNLKEIDAVLDEVGNGHEAELTSITGRFAAHFRLKQKAEDAQQITELLELESFDETSHDRLNDAYPILAEAFDDACLAEDGCEMKEGAAQAAIATALQVEREREMEPEKQEILDGHCCFGKMTEVQKELMRHGAPVACRIGGVQ